MSALDPEVKVTVAKKTKKNAAITKATKAALAKEFNDVKNLWVGDSSVNSSEGSRMKHAEEARERAKRARNQKAQEQAEKELAKHGVDVPKKKEQGKSHKDEERALSEKGKQKIELLEGKNDEVDILREKGYLNAEKAETMLREVSAAVAVLKVESLKIGKDDLKKVREALELGVWLEGILGRAMASPRVVLDHDTGVKV